MRRLLVCQHVPHELLGILDPMLRRAGFRIRYVNFARQPDRQPTMDRYHGLVVLGGPMNCDETDRYPHLATELGLIDAALEAGKPVLGICLGAQLVARALGARVRRSPVREIGWYRLEPTPAAAADPLFTALAPTQQVFQWHGDTFDIPAGAVHLAASPDCPNQAFRYGENVYGLQFHLEVDGPMIERWLRVTGNARELAALGEPARVAARIRADTARLIDPSLGLGEQVFGRWIERVVHHRRRRQRLPSR